MCLFSCTWKAANASHPMQPFSRSFSAAIQLMLDFRKEEWHWRGQFPLSKSSCILLCKKFWFIFSPLLNYKWLLCTSDFLVTATQVTKCLLSLLITPERALQSVSKKSGLNEPNAASCLSSSDHDDTTKILFTSPSLANTPFPLTSPLVMILNWPS